MPDGLLNTLTLEEVGDLFAYLTQGPAAELTTRKTPRAKSVSRPTGGETHADIVRFTKPSGTVAAIRAGGLRIADVGGLRCSRRLRPATNWRAAPAAPFASGIRPIRRTPRSGWTTRAPWLRPAAIRSSSVEADSEPVAGKPLLEDPKKLPPAVWVRRLRSAARTASRFAATRSWRSTCSTPTGSGRCWSVIRSVRGSTCAACSAESPRRRRLSRPVGQAGPPRAGGSDPDRRPRGNGRDRAAARFDPHADRRGPDHIKRAPAAAPSRLPRNGSLRSNGWKVRPRSRTLSRKV